MGGDVGEGVAVGTYKLLGMRGLGEILDKSEKSDDCGDVVDAVWRIVGER